MVHCEEFLSHKQAKTSTKRVSAKIPPSANIYSITRFVTPTQSIPISIPIWITNCKIFLWMKINPSIYDVESEWFGVRLWLYGITYKSFPLLSGFSIWYLIHSIIYDLDLLDRERTLLKFNYKQLIAGFCILGFDLKGFLWRLAWA